MDDWISFLIFIGLFYVVMRYGCGAHMLHGRHGSNKYHQKSEDINHTDPVCGMTVNADEGYGKMHNGTLYRFCSRSCLDKFESYPEQYTTKTEGKGDNV